MKKIISQIKKNNWSLFLLLHAILCVYSIGAVFSKLASTKEFLSLKFIILYGAVITILFIYAILWQQILKRMSVTTAFANKSVVVVWGMIWGKLIFGEKITINMILGAMIIFAGVYLVVSEDG